MAPSLKVGIIGGTGFADPDILKNAIEKDVNTPFGPCSDTLKIGTIEGVDCILLARHSKGHNIMPSLVNYRANIWALAQEQCTHIIVTTAVGSLREEIKPGDMVLLDQFIDRTYRRNQTFYDQTDGGPAGMCHIPMHTPFCAQTRDVVTQCLVDLGLRHHTSGTVVTIEGPRFSTKAESKMFRLMGGDVINMTVGTEAVLAKEAGISYTAIALVTDYDCWRDGHDHVNVEMVMKTMKENAVKAKEVILKAIPRLAVIDWGDMVRNNKNIVAGSVM